MHKALFILIVLAGAIHPLRSSEILLEIEQGKMPSTVFTSDSLDDNENDSSSSMSSTSPNTPDTETEEANQSEAYANPLPEPVSASTQFEEIVWLELLEETENGILPLEYTQGIVSFKFYEVTADNIFIFRIVEEPDIFINLLETLEL